MNEFNKAITRIKKIDWDDIKQNKSSFLILGSEFIRRTNIFRDIYQNERKHRTIIFNAREIINENIPQEVKNEIEEINFKNTSWLTELLCKCYLEWTYLIDKEVDIAIEYKELYEPIIRLFERGGRLNYHDSQPTCGRYSWVRDVNLIPRDVCIEKMDNQTLDEIDDKNMW